MPDPRVRHSIVRLAFCRCRIEPLAASRSGESGWAYFRFLAFLAFFFAVLRAAGFFAAIDRFFLALRAFFAIALSS